MNKIYKTFDEWFDDEKNYSFKRMGLKAWGDYISHNRYFGIGWNARQPEIDQLKFSVEELETLNFVMQTNGNCKWGGGNNCSYPNAVFTNCHTACDKWQLDTRLHGVKKELKLNERRKI